jgi:hypothetical protein
MQKIMLATTHVIVYLQPTLSLIALKLAELNMTVAAQHPDYTTNIAKWQRCIDVCKGQDAIHAAGVTYLDKLSDQTDTDYKAYRDRTPFYNATWRTVVGLQGMVFRKPPKVEVPPVVEPMLKNIDLRGTPLKTFALEVTEECLKVGRVGIWVDYPEVISGATEADGRNLGYRPSLKLYKALSIINWKTKTIGNVTMLSMVVVKECITTKKDEFEDEEGVQYRVLDLINMEIDGIATDVYRVRIFTINEKNEDVLMSTAFPMIKGKFLDKIPFQFIGVDDVSWEVDEPPLGDLVDMNISHYKTTADYEHGCHFTGLPTPVITGYQLNTEGEKFYLGSTTAWVFPRADAKASFLEFTGQGLSCLENNLTKKEGYMAILGARMLEVQRAGVESANTAAIHRSGEQSMLASIAESISIGIQIVLGVFCQFAGSDVEPKFMLNKDFFPVPMDALTITALIAGWQNGAYSYDTLFTNLQQGDIIPLENSVEQEQSDMAKNPPPLIAAPTTPGNVKKEGPKTAAAPATPAPTITQLQNT